MTLTPWEQQELEQLLWRQQMGMVLAPYEQDRLRELVVKQNPQAAGLSWSEVITAGLVIVGAVAFLKWLSRE
jgi:hypothetical protein